MKIASLTIEHFFLVFDKNQELERGVIEEYLKSITGNSNTGYILNSIIRKGIIERTGRGKYCIGVNRKLYRPNFENEIKDIFKLIYKEKPLLECCIWRTSIVNEFTLHQPGRFNVIVEIERDGLDAVFDLLRDNFSNVYLTPSNELLDRYIPYQNDAIIIIPLITEAPTQIVDGIRTVTIEKLMVDLICEPKLYETFQGAELSYILCEAFRKYQINMNKLLRYASRRRKRDFVNNLINVDLCNFEY